MANQSIEQLSFIVLNQSGDKTNKTAEIQWIELEEISPHPDNPRLFMREEVVEAIASSVKEKGFDPCYAVLVRPLDGEYQMISGHHRLEGCKQAGVTHIAAWVREMDDDEAYLELVRGNNQGELKPLEIGLHALHYVEKGSKWDKDNLGIKGYASEINKSEASVSQFRSAAKVYQIYSSKFDPSDLLDKTKHLYHISKAPESEWPWLVSQLLEQSWSVKDTESAVKVVNSISDIPEYLHVWINPDMAKKKAIADPQYAKRVNRWVHTAIDHFDSLNEAEKAWQFDENGSPYQADIFPQKMFIGELEKTVAKKDSAPSDEKTKGAYERVLKAIAAYQAAYKQWEVQQQSKDAAEQAEREAELERIRLEKLYTPESHYMGLLDVDLPLEHFDALITDCPYLISNDGTTCRSGKETTVNKNFEDSREAALSPMDWISCCWDSLKPGAALVTTCTHHIRREIHAALEEMEAADIYEIIWHVTNPPPLLSAHMPIPSHEYIVIGIKPGPRYFGKEEYEQRFNEPPRTVIKLPHCSGDERLGDHDTQKPLDLYKRLITLYCPSEGIVLEPFAGTGTTAVAAKLLGRRSVYVEKVEKFFDIAGDRIAETPFHWEVEE